VYKPSKTTTKRSHCSDNELNKLKQQSTVNSQNTADDLKILLRILSIINIFIISSIIHLCDYALYAWTLVDTISIRTPQARRTFRRTHCSSGWASFDRHISSGLACCHLYRYRLPWTSIHIYRDISLRRIFRRSVVSGTGIIYGFEESTGNWSQIDLHALG